MTCRSASEWIPGPLTAWRRLAGTWVSTTYLPAVPYWLSRCGLLPATLPVCARAVRPSACAMPDERTAPRVGRATGCCPCRLSGAAAGSRDCRGIRGSNDHPGRAGWCATQVMRLSPFRQRRQRWREGEAFLAGSIDSTEHFTDTGNDGLWTPAPPGERERWALAGVWEPAGSRSRKVTNPIEAVAAQPRFIVERLASLEIAPSPHLVEESTVASEQRLEIFRITGRGVGRSGAASAMVQGTYGMLL